MKLEWSEAPVEARRGGEMADAAVPPAEGASAGAQGATAAVGTHVELELVDEEGGTEHLSVDIVPDSEADFAQGLLGAGTPLARAVLGQTAGSTVPYRMSDVTAVRVCGVGERAGAPGEGAGDRRQAVVRRAVARSEMINDMAFALAAGSKWGDYDPAKLRTEPPDEA